jgi:hypothetical protein
MTRAIFFRQADPRREERQMVETGGLFDPSYLSGLRSVDLPPRPPEAKEVIESKLIPCERCGTVVAMLIFAPNATDAGHLEDYAHKMYPHYNHINVPTWIIGPALGEGPLIDRPASAGADPTVATCAIQFAPRSVCHEALS